MDTSDTKPKEITQGVCIDEEGRLLLCIHIRTNGDKELILVGGKIEPGSSAAETMWIEVMQEMKLNATIEGVICTVHHRDSRGYITSGLYRIRVRTDVTPDILQEEIDGIFWVTRQEMEKIIDVKQRPYEDANIFYRGYKITYLTHRILRKLLLEMPEWN
jgi:ADP-ribose pyrophosphatase YjhB (NUDIX family)